MIALRPVPETIYVDDKGKPTKDFFNWLRSIFVYLSKAGQEQDLGTGSGTVHLDLANGPKQKITNNGAFTLAAPTDVGDCHIRVTNGASAGSITFSGFTKKYTSDALDTTNAHQFIIRIWSYGGAGADYDIKARQ